MSRIIAGRFQTQADADRALAALPSAGLAPGEVATFYLGPPGQHDQFPIGGDAHHDEGTRNAGPSAATAGAIGGVAGLAVGALAGAVAAPALAPAAAIAGAGVGAYVGSLAGALDGSHAGDPRVADIEEPVERRAGVMVAASVDRSGVERAVFDALREAGALEIEEAQGLISGGAWQDFDPRVSAKLLFRSPETIAPGRAGESGPSA
jgi:hypothetical protein